MADTIATIVNFFRNKGLPDKIIAAILGNMQTESGFNTGASNAAEGAIGLAQWEGGRRTALQQYAAQRGTSETDLNTQLNFMYDHELSNAPYNTILGEMNSAPSAGAAAAIWDQKYEGSSGAARSQRMAQAESFAASGLSSAGVSVGTSSGGGGQAFMQSAGGAPATLSPAQQKAALLAGIGPLASLLTSVPELSALLNKAITSGQTAAEFQNAVNNSQWYRTHSDSVRNGLVQQASDPKTYAKMLAQEQAKVRSLANQMGVQLTPQQLAKLGTQSYLQGYTQDQLTAQLAGMFNQKGQLGGQAAQIHDDLAKSAALYGQSWTEQQVRYRTQQVLANPGMLDTYKEQMKTAAKAMFPGLSSQLDAGLTVEDVASPYKQTMANLLEVDPATLTLNDRMIKSALQGTGNVAKGQQPTATPVWQFEQQVRADPRWQLTNNARQDTAATLESLGKQWGLSAA
jgi:hypothetical protein